MSTLLKFRREMAVEQQAEGEVNASGKVHTSAILLDAPEEVEQKGGEADSDYRAEFLSEVEGKTLCRPRLNG